MHQRGQWPVEQIRDWIELQGKTHQWVAEKLGCRNQTISKVCRKHAIKTQRTGPRGGAGHPEWKGGRLQTRDGYIRVFSPGHPFATLPRRKYVFEHRLVMEKHLGRYLQPGEVVHHKNGVRDDNRIENLQLYASNAEHLSEELKGRCPKWSEEGKKRIRSAVKTPDGMRRVREAVLGKTNLQRSIDGAERKRQKSLRLKALSESIPPSP